MIMILWPSESPYLQQFPQLIKGKGGTCLFAIARPSKPRVGWRCLKAVQNGRQELMLVKLLRFNPQFELSLELRPTSGVAIVLRLLSNLMVRFNPQFELSLELRPMSGVAIILRWLRNLMVSQRGRVQKRFQPNTACNGGHLCGIISRTSSGEGLGEQKLG